MFSMDRRDFLKGMAASAAMAAVGGMNLHAAVPEGKKPLLRFGAVSDVHIYLDPKCTDTWEKTLKWYDEQKVDAVLVAGDIADWGLVQQLQNFSNVWDKVFPNDKSQLDGRHVEKIFVCGNHDVDGWTYGARTKEDRDARFEKSIKKDIKAAWDLCFHEEFKGIYTKVVKGYTFIGGHWGWDRGIEQYMEENKSKIDPNLPFFYTQHPHPKDTVYGPWAWGHDNGFSTRTFSKFPNSIVLTGHSHYPLTDESGIWQDTFTSIGTASLRYVGTRYGRENSDEVCRPTEPDLQMRAIGGGNSRQGMLFSIYDDQITIGKRDFSCDKTLGEDWVLPLPLCKEKPYYHPKRKLEYAKNLPAFAADAAAQIAVTEAVGKNRRGADVPQVTVTFPAGYPAGDGDVPRGAERRTDVRLRSAGGADVLRCDACLRNDACLRGQLLPCVGHAGEDREVRLHAGGTAEKGRSAFRHHADGRLRQPRQDHLQQDDEAWRSARRSREVNIN